MQEDDHVLREFADRCKRLFVHQELGHADFPSEAAELRALLERELGYTLLDRLESWQSCTQGMFRHFGAPWMDRAAVEGCFTEGGDVDYAHLNRLGERLPAAARYCLCFCLRQSVKRPCAIYGGRMLLAVCAQACRWSSGTSVDGSPRSSA